ncbi:hypothetical protein LTR08_003342 [Meristemomyces frigidus]|nr:hypothetical protein LTR08_003342 [Meristemomyces frigidus]
MPPIELEEEAKPVSSMSLALEVRERLEPIIASWASSKERPPFTAKQLFIMALLCEGRTMTIREIMKWTVDHFIHHQVLAFESLFGLCGFTGSTDFGSHNHGNDIDHDRVDRAEEFCRQLNEVPSEFDLPLVIEQEDNLQNSPRYSISAGNGEQVLATVLCLRNFEKVFPFFELPAELRNVIYEMVFRYPRSGLCVQFPDPKACFPARAGSANILTRSMDDGIDLTPGNIFSRNQSWTQSIQTILSPLSVSRQLYKEAAPCFYSVNNFRFRNSRAMHTLLLKVPAQHLKHISHITLAYSKTYHRANQRTIIAAFKLLGSLKGLRKLEVYCDERGWSNGDYGPWIDALGKIRGLEELKFFGCPTIEGLVKNNMLKPKPTEKVRGATLRKRKAGDDCGDAAPTKKIVRTKKS